MNNTTHDSSQRDSYKVTKVLQINVGINTLMYRVGNGLNTMACSFIGKPFETTQLMNYPASSVISSIVYGRRFEYTDPQLRNKVDRANESIRLSRTASVQVHI